MPTPAEIKAVAAVLADESNTEATAEEVAEKVWAVVEAQRRRKYKYVVIAQSRRKDSEGLKSFYPTWAKGPFSTASEAALQARKERAWLTSTGHVVHNKTGTASVMTAQVFDLEDEVDPETLEEVKL